MKWHLWRILMWLWCRDASQRYGGSEDGGPCFNTACFQQAVGKTTGQTPGEQTSKMWLASYGMFPGYGGCHWFRDRKKADATFGLGQKDQANTQ
jgi:hypothetical protein